MPDHLRVNKTVVDAESESTVPDPIAPVRTTDAFLEILATSRLVPSDVLNSLRINVETDPDPTVSKLAAKLEREGLVTHWQCQQLLAGKTQFFLGRYKFLDRLGVGGMGAVFKAEHTLMGRIVALKMIRRHLLESESTFTRFLREIKALAALQDPNIVIAHDADRVGDTCFLVMEYVDGKDLGWWVEQRGPIAPQWACEFCRQAALGLQHAHERGFVHRDIKPTNLFAAREPPPKPPTIKILDFGLTLLCGENATPDNSPVTTAAGTSRAMTSAVGTMGFMAPEQIRTPSETDIRADVFSLGCTLFYLLSGRLPYDGEDDMEYLRKLMKGEPKSVRSYKPNVPAGVESVVMRMVARDPADRYQTPQEVADALWPFSASTVQAFSKSRMPIPVPKSIAAPAPSSLMDQPAIDPGLSEFGNVLSNEPSESMDLLSGEFGAATPLATTRVHETTQLARQQNQPPTGPLVQVKGEGRYRLPGRRLTKRQKRQVAAVIVAGSLLLAGLITAVALVGRDRQGVNVSDGPPEEGPPTVPADAKEPKLRLFSAVGHTSAKLQPGQRRAAIWSGRDSDPSKMTWHFSANDRDPHAPMQSGENSFVADALDKQLLAACKRTNQLTIKATVTPGNLTQTGPARIISFSTDSSTRNFTLGQTNDYLVLRLRTLKNPENAANPEIQLFKIPRRKEYRVVVSYEPGSLTCFVDGRPVLRTNELQGDFSNWSPQHLLFGNEWNGERNWHGILSDVSISNHVTE